MNYRHAFHAGNFADVVKHVALVSILLHLQRKDTPFAVIDTHAGRGLYDLGGPDAVRTGEAEAGIARLRGLREGPVAMRRYLDVAGQFGAGRYPGSPLIAARLLRPQDRLVAIEKHPEEALALREVLDQFARARVVEADGYAQLRELLPPPERRGLILVDPPYESPDEFADLARALGTALKRFANGVYLVWFPIKSAPAADAFCGEIEALGSPRLHRLDIQTASDDSRDDGRLSAAGLLVVNAPYGFAEDMTAAAAVLGPCLGSGPQRPAKLSVLALRSI